MNNITHSIEAYDLAKSVLDNDLKSSFLDARIIGREGERKLCFYFDDIFVLDLFNQHKNEILEHLRVKYKNKIALYRRIDFVFYEICAQFKERQVKNKKSKEEQEILERGISRLKNLLERIKNDKRRK
ncbi:hypothetical protein [Campylobacter sp. US33a]|uniref:hypothetical protein n=1 Tax=Campylobacter sp. US33a TaxID=2498120 RepID=UPI001067357E|nr:hypothetical protein [Campylobacter sp. US33a]TEY03605.1 hypothetical protein ELQ16_03385 [Campylobacter sp. US33a]